MKFITSLTLTLAATATAASIPESKPADAAAADADVSVLDDTCYHPSACSSTWGGKCEIHCGDRGFSHMTGDGCSFFAKKCCCIVRYKTKKEGALYHGF
ncbi:hypothetical protein K4F52_006214 [Lecanicillium sp. MT-2017a]|nr:hypothetical protein K4F52_006214 [Lecanicillium sp. MT-2017a]